MHPMQDDQSAELVQSYATLAFRLQNLLPARSHEIRGQLDSALFALQRTCERSWCRPS